MQKILFISLCTLLSGCYIPLDLLFDESNYIPKEIVNPECDITADGIYTIQVLNNGVIGKPVDYYRPDIYTVDKSRFTRPSSNEPVIYISVRKENLKDKFDEAAFNLHENACLKADGVYSYIDTLGAKRTIQKFKMITPKFIKNPDYIDESK